MCVRLLTYWHPCVQLSGYSKYYIYKYNIDKKEYQKYFSELPKKVRRKARMRFIQKLSRKVLHKVIRFFNKKYKPTIAPEKRAIKKKYQKLKS